MYLDPSIVGILCNVLAMVIGSALTQVSPKEKEEREKLFIIPEVEKRLDEIGKTLKWTKASYMVGVIIFALMIVLWVIPYLKGLR